MKIKTRASLEKSITTTNATVNTTAAAVPTSDLSTATTAIA